MLLSRDVLDQRVVDRNEEPIGRLDALVISVRDDAPPRISELQLGIVPLMARVGSRLGRWVELLHKTTGVGRSARNRLPWSAVLDRNPRRIEVDCTLQQTSAYDWDRWLRRHIIGKVTRSGKDA